VEHTRNYKIKTLFTDIETRWLYSTAKIASDLFLSNWDSTISYKRVILPFCYSGKTSTDEKLDTIQFNLLFVKTQSFVRRCDTRRNSKKIL